MYSPFLNTLSIILFTVLGVAHIAVAEDKNFRDTFKGFIQHKGFLAVTAIFFIVLLSGIYTENWNDMAEKIRIKLPFLILPFAFFSLPSLSKRHFYHLFYGLLVVMFISSIVVAIDGFSNYAETVQNIDKGKSFDTPINHIRYSLLLTLAILSGYFIWKERITIRYQWENKVVLMATLWLFLFIHVLSVRSGLMSLYAAIFFLLIHYILQTKKYLLGGLLMLGLFSLPIVAYFSVPSFKTKIEYTLRDLKNYNEGFAYHYNDGQRLVSWEIGIRVGNQHPVLGVGYGDVLQEVAKIYAEDYPTLEKRPDPHNQFIFFYVGTGLLGLGLFLWCFFTPLFYQKGYQHAFLLAFHVVIFFSFIPENTINSSVGTSVYVIPLLVLLNHYRQQSIS